MNKKNLIITVLLSILIACNNNDEINGSEPNYDVKIEVLHTLDFNSPKYPDAGAKVYVYYGFDGNIFTFSDYEGDGKFNYEGQIFNPKQTFEISKDGKLIFTPLNLNEEITIVVQSGRYHERISSEYYPSAKRKIDSKIIFHKP